MKGNEKVIAVLNGVLANELIAINQYLLHSRMMKNWGMNKIGDYEYGESIDEMKHADKLVERILFLDGLPNLQDLGRLRIGENLKEMLECDMALEVDAVKDLREGIIVCEQERDFVSRDLLTHILDNEEEHVDFLEAQFTLIEEMGMQNYVQLQSSPAE